MKAKNQLEPTQEETYDFFTKVDWDQEQVQCTYNIHTLHGRACRRVQERARCCKGVADLGRCAQELHRCFQDATRNQEGAGKEITTI